MVAGTPPAAALGPAPPSSAPPPKNGNVSCGHGVPIVNGGAFAPAHRAVMVAWVVTAMRSLEAGGAQPVIGGV